MGLRHPIIRGSIRSGVDCDICGKECGFLLQIGFSENRDEDKKYCINCKEKLFDSISENMVLSKEINKNQEE